MLSVSVDRLMIILTEFIYQMRYTNAVRCWTVSGTSYQHLSSPLVSQNLRISDFAIESVRLDSFLKFFGVSFVVFAFFWSGLVWLGFFAKRIRCVFFVGSFFVDQSERNQAKRARVCAQNIVNLFIHRFC